MLFPSLKTLFTTLFTLVISYTLLLNDSQPPQNQNATNQTYLHPIPHPFLGFLLFGNGVAIQFPKK